MLRVRITCPGCTRPLALDGDAFQVISSACGVVCRYACPDCGWRVDEVSPARLALLTSAGIPVVEVLPAARDLPPLPSQLTEDEVLATMQQIHDALGTT